MFHDCDLNLGGLRAPVSRQPPVPRRPVADRPPQVAPPWRNHVRQNHAGMTVQRERLRHHWIDILHHHADSAAMDVAIFADLLINVAHDVRRNGETNSFAAARLRVDHRVDASHFFHSYRAAGRRYCPDVYRGIGLDIRHRLVWLQLSRCGADVSGPSACYPAPADYQARTRSGPVSECRSRGRFSAPADSSAFNFQDGEIRFFIDADNDGRIADSVCARPFSQDRRCRRR